jgi:photosystem II stability/assembly factor-like uncharacterized protein
MIKPDMKKLLLLISILLLAGCSTENTEIFTLSTSVNPQEAGSISPSQGEFDEGDEVTLTASANEHWVFSGWQGDYSGTSNPAVIVMNSNKSISAMFEKRDYEITMETVGEGTIEERIVSAKSVDYPHGTVVELTAVPDEGWEFIEWNGEITGDENPVQITVDGPMSISATFEPEPAAVVPASWISTGSDARLSSVQFITDELGWVAGEGLIAKTTDGGENWTFQMEDEFNVLDLFMVNEQTGYATASSAPNYDSSVQGVYRTVNGGDDWELVYQTNETPYTIFFVNESTGWVAGDNDLIIKTTDGGDSWQRQDQFEGTFENDDLSFFIVDLFFLDEETGWGVGQYSPADNFLIIRTSDGGDTWEVASSYVGPSLRLIHMFDENRGLTGSNRAISQVSNGGENVNQVFNHTTFGMVNDFAIVKESRGFLIGTNLGASAHQFLYETTDEGDTWTAVNTEDIVSGVSIDLGEGILWIASGPFLVKVEI